MKKYLPYILNLSVVFLGIVFPYLAFNENSIYDNHEIIIFILISFALTITLNIFSKIHLRHWICSSVIFYITVLLVFLLGDQWGLNTKSIFAPFQIQYCSGKHHDPLPRILKFNYPIGILILTILNLLIQLIAVKLVGSIRYRHEQNT